jgi:hypothetical protein
MKAVIGGLLFLAGLYLFLVLCLYVFQRQLMYVATPFKPEAPPGVARVTVTTTDGLSLYGWFHPPASDEHPVLIRFHGNASNAAWSYERAEPFIAAGYGVLIVEYRGYAGNPGSPNEEGLYNDARAFTHWAKARGIAEDRIILYGESLGSGPAVAMAVEHQNIRALILEAPFTSIADVAARIYPFVPVRLLLKDRYDNLSRIAKISAPLIIAHGTSDGVVPYALGRQLFDAAMEPKTMISIEGGGHNDLHDRDISAKILTALEQP